VRAGFFLCGGGAPNVHASLGCAREATCDTRSCASASDVDTPLADLGHQVDSCTIPKNALGTPKSLRHCCIIAGCVHV
jgi:hypothetical protein